MTDISKLQLDNKTHNIEFLLKSSIFKILAQKTYSVTDISQAYVPWISNDDSPYMEPCAENNYADLSFINCGEYFNFKACRVRTLEAIPMDGNILTYADGTINHNNFIVFYTIRPDEAKKIFIIDTETYNLLTSHNYLSKIRYFNSNDVEKLRESFHLKDEWVSLIDYTEENIMSSEYEKNVEIKRIHCLQTLIMIKNYKAKSKGKLIWKKTHYGKQYSAYNLVTGEMRQFRDCQSRNNFFKMSEISLNDHVVNRNCKNMDAIVKNEKSDSYKINLRNGWVIMNYIPDHAKMVKFVEKLIVVIHKNSKRIFEKINEFLKKCEKNIMLVTNTACQKIKGIRKSLRNKFNYFRPLSLYDFVTKNEKMNFDIYFRDKPKINAI